MYKKICLIIFLLATNSFAALSKSDFDNTSKDLLEKLRNSIHTSCGGSPVAKFSELFNEKDFTLTLAQFQFFSECGGKVIDSLLKTEDGKTFMQEFLMNRAVLEEFMYTGIRKPNGENITKTLFDVWKVDKNLFKNKLYRKMGIAISLAVGGGDRYKNYYDSRGIKADERYIFFKNSFLKKKLHSSFATFEAWDMYLVMASQRSDKALAWLQENATFPIQRYAGAAYAGNTYALFTQFGDSIHGPKYYEPWKEVYVDCESTRKVGGVCGSLSYFGTHAALAHGVPAFTCGQPGHCAYAVREARGKYVGGNMGPDGGCHVAIFDKYSHCSDFQYISDEIYTNKSKVLTSSRAAWVANSYAESRPELAQKCFDYAVKAQPNNLISMMEYISFLEKKSVLSEKQIISLANFIGNGYEIRPYVGIFLLEKLSKIKSKEIKSVDNKIIISPIFRTCKLWYHRGLGNKFEDVLKNLWKDVKGDKDQQEMIKTILGSMKNSNSLATAISWFEDNYAITPAKSETMLKLLISSMLKGADDTKDLGKIYSRLILLAGASRNTQAFQNLSKRGSKYLNENDKKMIVSIQKSVADKMKIFPGELLSEKGAIQSSSTCGADKPLTHVGILTTNLGFCQTQGADKASWIEAQLSLFGELSGICIVSGAGKSNEGFPLIVSVSEDGDDWKEIEKLTQAEHVWNLDLRGKRVRAKFIRIENSGEKKALKIAGILAYGRRLQ